MSSGGGAWGSPGPTGGITAGGGGVTTGGEVFEFVAREALQIFGGAGYLRGTAVERLYREVRVLAIGGGSEEIMRDLAVRQMGL